MSHIAALKAVTTVGTEAGVFTAVISTGAVDRQKDIVDPDRMVKALQKWVEVGKKIPLDWNHGEGAKDQIGRTVVSCALSPSPVTRGRRTSSTPRRPSVSRATPRR